MSKLGHIVILDHSNVPSLPGLHMSMPTDVGMLAFEWLKGWGLSKGSHYMQIWDLRPHGEAIAGGYWADNGKLRAKMLSFR